MRRSLRNDMKEKHSCTSIKNATKTKQCKIRLKMFLSGDDKYVVYCYLIPLWSLLRFKTQIM